MTVVLLADLHLSDNPRDGYRHKTLRKIADVIEGQMKPPITTIILGDLTEAKDRHSSRLVNHVVRHIRRFAYLGQVYVLKGNHDYSTSPDHPFFQFLDGFPNVHWINKPKVLDIDELGGSSLWLPHTRNWKRDWKDIDLERGLIFAHQTFKGANMGNYIARDGVPTKMFNPKTKIFSGDVHVGQSFDNVTYVGAPYTIDFGDTYKPRMMVYKEKKWFSAPIPGPQKRLVDYKPADSTRIISSWGLQDQLRQLSKGDILKVRVHLDRRSAEKWPAIRNHVREWASNNGFVLHATIPVIEDAAGPTMKIKRPQTKSDEEIIREFAQHRNLNPKMVAYGEELL